MTTVESVSYETFFKAMERWAIFGDPDALEAGQDGGTYIFYDIKPDSNGETRIYYFDRHWGDSYSIPESNWDDTVNNWIVAEKDGKTVTADHLTRQIIIQREGTNKSVAAGYEREELLLKEIRELKSDLDMINGKINAYADETHMCGDYERRIFGWNADLIRYKMTGRIRNYSVPVRIPALADNHDDDGDFTLYPVEARSPEEALELVKNWPLAQVLSVISQRGYRLKGFEVTYEDETLMQPYM
jgi:hypothetical protein